MSAAGPIEGRWREGVHQPRHERAARLVARLSEPRPLDAAALERVEDRLFAAECEPRCTNRRVAAALAVVAAAACVAVALLLSRASAPGAGARVAILGDGAAVLESDGSVHIRRGRLAVRTGSAPLRLVAPSLAVTARPSSVVEVDVTRSRVACHLGSAEAQWEEGPLYQLRALAGATPSGPISVDEAAGAEVMGALARVPEAPGGAEAPVLTRVALDSEWSRPPAASEGGRPAPGAATAHRPPARSSRPASGAAPDLG